ncbi:response regulator [Glaciecola sp. 1036]|uniref:response regulator n=1 Tax=Alteromonadaceae TaxID=72275 RepID=UPI003D062A67
MNDEIEKLKRRVAREKSARQESERLLEEISAQLYEKNLELYSLSESLEKLVAQRTAQMQKARDEALSALRVRSDFIANMSHELRTPMNGVLGVLTLLKDTALNDDQNELVQVAESSGKHLLEVINDILDFSKIEADKISLEMSSFAIRPYLENLVSGFKLQAKQKGIELNLLIDDDVETIMESDSLRVTQIITNLLSNAIKFTNEGGVELHFSRLSNGLYQIMVSDSGIGISQDKLMSVFSAFEQADTSITRQFGGTGLGMNITKRLVELFGGKIHVESELNKGTQFFVTLPMKVIEDSDAVAAMSEKIQDSLQSDAHVLLVEDNHVNQMIAQRLLQGFGFKVTLAENGEQALAELNKEADFDMIFMDLQMPVMGGIEATQQIRQQQLIEPHIPIIAMTAHSSPEHVKECIEAGMQSHISKPIDKQNLITVIKEHLEIKQQVEHQEKLDLPEIQGVDIANAIQRINGDWNLYQRLVEHFLQEHSDTFERFSSLKSDVLVIEELEKLEAIFHRLKGSGANLGMVALADLAADLEAKIRLFKSLDASKLAALSREYFKLKEAFDTVIRKDNQESQDNLREVSTADIRANLQTIKEEVYKDLSLAEGHLISLLQCKMPEATLASVQKASQALQTFDLANVDKAINQALVTLE